MNRLDSNFLKAKPLILFLIIFNFFSVALEVSAQEVRVLSNSSHFHEAIRGTIAQLLGPGHLDVDVIVHRSSLNDSNFLNESQALNTSAVFYESTSSNPINAAPYHLLSSSFTGNSGDSVSLYNQFDGVDFVHNYALTFPTITGLPPVFKVSAGNSVFGSRPGIEWTIDGTEIAFYSGTGGTASELTARNGGLLAAVRHDHPSWNWFDVKAAIRQTASNWPTGYDDTDYGFGNAFYASSTALSNNQILLQPPVATVATSSVGQITFTLYPFKQTRRAKEVLFQFTSDPGFRANELTLNDIITTYGGTKVTDYTSTQATSDLKPISTAVNNAYFVWFTADNLNDNLANFSRIDTYSVLGPYSQPAINFSNTFNLISPANNITIDENLPVFTWGNASSSLGINKYQLYINGVLNRDNISGTTTTPSAPLTNGTYTWHVVAVNGNGATTSSISTRTFTVAEGFGAGNQTWYVDNVNGNDNNAGTWSAPWASINKATSTALAGNTVVILKNEGVPYRESVIPAQGNAQDGDIIFRGLDAENKPEIWGSINVSQGVVGGWTTYGGGASSTYQKNLSDVSVLATGLSTSSLTVRTKGSSNQNLLNEGEWTTDGSIVYYRLNPNEDINTIHIETENKNYGLSCASRNTFKDLIVRYSEIGVSLNTRCTGEGLEVYDSGDTGVFMTDLSSGTNQGALLRYSIIAGSDSYGVNMQSLTYGKLENNTIFDNDTGLRLGGWAHYALVRNNTFFDNTNNIDVSFITIVTNFNSSNNNWDNGTIDGDWTNTYQGANNLANSSPLLVNASQRDFRLQQLSPNIDTGINTGINTDALGNNIYGNRDIGAIEYQPPYAIGTHQINTTGSIRLYADGQYRYLNATSSSNSANLAVTPQNGFGTGDFSEYLDLTINNWPADTDGSIKSWTASSSYATTTVFSITNLENNASYNVKVDGLVSSNISGSNCNSGVCTSNGSGLLSFTYTGGWSTHAFSVEKIAAPEPTTSGGGGGGGGGSSKKKNTPKTEVVSSNSSTTTPIKTSDEQALRKSLLQKIDELKKLILTLGGKISPNPVSPVSYKFSRLLTAGDDNEEVLMLQKKLNSLGFIISTQGIGSPGNETTYFGSLTVNALMKFQCQYNIICSGSPATTGYGKFGPQTLRKMNEL